MTFLRGSVFLSLLCACSGSSTSGTPNGGVGQVMLPDGGTVPSVKCGNENVSSIAGTWDVLGSRAGGGQSAAVVTIDKSSFSFSAGGKSLTYSVSGATMTLVWRDDKEVPITVTHTDDGALALGLFPLPVGGKWAFSSASGSESCTSSLGPNGFDATCNVRSTPLGRLEGTVIGPRQQSLSSVFGDLGGVWRLSGQGKGSVVATIAGNTFAAVSTGGGGPLGNNDSWVTVKVCNGTASGKTSDGFEFAATRQ